jgi:hypothetical protein
MSAQIPRRRYAAEHPIRQNAKKEVERAEIALQRMRTKAAGLLAPELPKQSMYIYKVLRHKDSGVRVRVLDTQAPDAPAGLFDLPLRFVVECQTHGGSPQSYASVSPAMRAARHSYEWCEGCAEVMGPRRERRARARARAAEQARPEQHHRHPARGQDGHGTHRIHLPELHLHGAGPRGPDGGR